MHDQWLVGMFGHVHQPFYAKYVVAKLDNCLFHELVQYLPWYGFFMVQGDGFDVVMGMGG